MAKNCRFDVVVGEQRFSCGVDATSQKKDRAILHQDFEDFRMERAIGMGGEKQGCTDRYFRLAMLKEWEG